MNTALPLWLLMLSCNSRLSNWCAQHTDILWVGLRYAMRKDYPSGLRTGWFQQLECSYCCSAAMLGAWPRRGSAIVPLFQQPAAEPYDPHRHRSLKLLHEFMMFVSKVQPGRGGFASLQLKMSWPYISNNFKTFSRIICPNFTFIALNSRAEMLKV